MGLPGHILQNTPFLQPYLLRQHTTQKTHKQTHVTQTRFPIFECYQPTDYSTNLCCGIYLWCTDMPQCANNNLYETLRLQYLVMET